jgi:RNA polymerase sigma factor, sigma-70 family
MLSTSAIIQKPFGLPAAFAKRMTTGPKPGDAPRAVEDASDSAGEQAWLPAARRGERWALAHFYETYYPMVWGLCRRLLRTEADAEDVLQSTFVKAFAALPRFRGESRNGQGGATLKTWLYRIAVNEATSLLRRHAAAPLTMSLDDDRDQGGYALAAAAAASPGGRPEGDGARVAEQVAVRELVSLLKPDHRAVLVLRFWEDLAYEEIAAVLELPLATVKMRLHRAKEEFRRLYSGSGDGNDALFAGEEVAR